MDDLLIITREILDEHLQKMETVLTRLRDSGLKVNAAKSLFYAHEIEYLGYTDQRRNQTPTKESARIFALNLPNNVKELRHFLGMELFLSFGDSNCSLVNVCIPTYVGHVTWSHT